MTLRGPQALPETFAWATGATRAFNLGRRRHQSLSHGPRAPAYDTPSKVQTFGRVRNMHDTFSAHQMNVGS